MSWRHTASARPFIPSTRNWSARSSCPRPAGSYRITGYRAVIDPAKVGLGHIAFVEVKLSNTTDKALNAFNAAVRKLAEVEQCHMIAGGFDYLLKVRTGDITAYRHVLGEKISALPHVAQSSTYVAMEAVKDEARELGWALCRAHGISPLSSPAHASTIRSRQL